MYSTSLLKSLSGGDTLRGEKKGVQDTINFEFGGKLIITTNTIPELADHEDEGFKGRATLIDFINIFSRKATDIINNIPNEEFEGLLFYCITRIREWYKNDDINIRGLSSWDERVKEYESKSEPLIIFIKDFCEIDEVELPDYSNYKIKCFDLLNSFNDWMISKGKKSVENHVFGRRLNKILKDKIKRKKETIGDKIIYYYLGIRLKD